MNRSISAICLALVLFFATGPVMAQNKPKKTTTKKVVEKDEPPPQIETLEDTRIDEVLPFDTSSVPNDELTTSIKELMKITGAMEVGKQMGRGIAELSRSGQANQLPQEFYDRLLKEFESGQTTQWMINSIVRIYRQKFTLEEIKTITAFYQTPIGKKTISLLPAIAQESMKEGEQIGRYLGMKVYRELEREGKIK
jgi:hypothetical protein